MILMPSLLRHQERILRINQGVCDLINELNIFAYKELKAEHEKKRLRKAECL
jgi:hypothetical protein